MPNAPVASGAGAGARARNGRSYATALDASDGVRPARGRQAGPWESGRPVLRWTPQIASGRPVVRSPRILHSQVRSDGAMIAIDAALQGRSEMRTVVLGATVALATSLAGVSGASATPITAAAIDEAAGAVSLMTKTITASSKQFKHHHHHHTSQPPTTAPTDGPKPRWVWPWGWTNEPSLYGQPWGWQSPGGQPWGWQSTGGQPWGWQSPGWQPPGGQPPAAGQKAY